MHDPMTVAWEIKSPIKRKSKLWPEGYRNTLVTIWHVDPEKDGTDDSCGWFKRARHGDKSVVDKIVKAFEFDWDRTFTSDGTGKTYPCGFFLPSGKPFLSVQAIVLNLFYLAAGAYFSNDGHRNWKKSRKWMQKNLFEILMFAENPVDSLHDGITQKFGDDTIGQTEARVKHLRDERIRNMASCIYGWILRSEQKWWQHPRWHVQHWEVQIHFLRDLKRFLFSRCCKCGRGFSWGHSVCTDSWNRTGPQWFRSEKNVYHSDCHRPERSEVDCEPKPA